jgi:hypothetical protein
MSHFQGSTSPSWQNELILEAVLNEFPTYLLSQVSMNNLTNNLPVNVQFTLHQLFCHLMVSGHQFTKPFKTASGFWAVDGCPLLDYVHGPHTLFEDMPTKKSSFPQTVSSILCFSLHLCCSMTTHKNKTYVLGCYRLTDLELLSLIPQGHKKNRNHCNFFFVRKPPLFKGLILLYCMFYVLPL